MSNWSRLAALVFLAACGAKSNPVPSNTAPNDPITSEPTPTEGAGGPSTVEGQMCGTRGASQCPEGQFCSYAAGALCGAADAPGHCAVPPEACTMDYSPVCGCDGKTYGNACGAASARTGVKDTGECPKP